MYINENLIPIFAIAVGLVITVISQITKYRIKVEQIRADALVRTEEVRARNQLELEKLMRQEENNSTATSGSYNESAQGYDGNNKTKGRVRE
jgi:hypothetical protein